MQSMTVPTGCIVPVYNFAETECVNKAREQNSKDRPSCRKDPKIGAIPFSRAVSSRLASNSVERKVVKGPRSATR